MPATLNLVIVPFSLKIRVPTWRLASKKGQLDTMHNAVDVWLVLKLFTFDSGKKAKCKYQYILETWLRSSFRRVPLNLERLLEN